MRSNFPEKSKPFEEAIREISNVILETAKDKIAFIILFGSFARGTWVRDRYSEDSTVYEYASDFDLLVITKSKRNDKEGISDFDLERKINKKLEASSFARQRHNPHFVIEPIDYVNSELEKGRYFFSDVKKEGILLYDSGEFELAEPKVLTSNEIKEMAQADYEHWFGKASNFLDIFHFLFDRREYTDSSFQLHQATEGLYNCTLLVLTGYKPKTHDLVELGKLCSAQSTDFLTVFPLATDEQKESFKLLNKSYIDSRYNKHFRIDKSQLEYLVARVELLKKIVEKVCKNRI